MQLSTRMVTLELAETFVIAREAQDTVDLVEVEIRHEGLAGYGEAAPIERYGETAASAAAWLQDAAELLGDDAWALDEIHARLPEGQQAARAAVDAALGATDVLDGLARRPRRHGETGRSGRGQVSPAEAQARCPRRTRRRACS